MTRSHIPHGLVELTQVLVESSDLQSWFVGLRAVPISDRNKAFNSMGRQLSEDGEGEEIVRAILSLAHPEIYRAVLNAVEEADRG